jgi:hypothetical protein
MKYEALNVCHAVTTVFDGLKYFPRQDEIISLQAIFTEHVEFYLLAIII